jgi:ribosome modulation factor
MPIHLIVAQVAGNRPTFATRCGLHVHPNANVPAQQVIGKPTRVGVGDEPCPDCFPPSNAADQRAVAPTYDEKGQAWGAAYEEPMTDNAGRRIAKTVNDVVVNKTEIEEGGMGQDYIDDPYGASYELQRAERAGQEAARSGKTRASCPIAKDCPVRRAWLIGFDKMQRLL